MVKNVTKFHQAKIALKVATTNKAKNQLGRQQKSYIPAAQRVFKPDVFNQTQITNFTEKTVFPTSLIKSFITKNK